MVEENQVSPAPIEPVKERIDLEEETPKGFSPLFWSVVVVAVLGVVLVMSFLVSWMVNGNSSPKSTVALQPRPTVISQPMVAVDESVSDLEKQNSSDEVKAIEADLEATNLSSLDRELPEIENELTP